MWQQTAMNENWNWEWRVNPHKRALYHWNQTHWTVRYPHNARRTYIDYNMHQRRTTLNNPAALPPATPIIDNTAQTIRILLPIHQIDKGSAIPRWSDDNLLTRLTTAPHRWIETLWHRIRPTAPLHVLHEHIQQWRMLHICSNVSVDAAKHSCSTWIIHTMTDLWHGEGVVPGNCDDNYS